MRNKTTLIAFALIFFLAAPSVAQQKSAELKATAEENLDKDPIRARYFFKQAYQAYARENNLDEAIRCGIMACDLFEKDNLYQESFDLLLAMEQAAVAADAEPTILAVRRYPIIKQRMKMYVAMRNSGKALEQLKKLEKAAADAHNDSISANLPAAQAVCYYNFGMMQQGDEALRVLISQAGNQTDYNQVRDCYQTLINVGKKANSARMVARAYDNYILWSDSVNALQADAKYAALNKQYKQNLDENSTKDAAINKRQNLIVTLSVLLTVLAAVIVLGALALTRLILLSRKQRKAAASLRAASASKTNFIRHIASQMQPALQSLDPTLPAVKALTSFLQHISLMAELEESADKLFETKEINIATFCNNLAEKMRPYVKTDVTLNVKAPKLSTPVNEEHLEPLLFHLLYNAARHTPAGGKITLEFRKRSAHTVQFLVSDTGDGIPQERQTNLFTPFTRKKDLMQGDGLGLPICALSAKKMNGTLTLDISYTKGARFLLELHV